MLLIMGLSEIQVSHVCCISKLHKIHIDLQFSTDVVLRDWCPFTPYLHGSVQTNSGAFACLDCCLNGGVIQTHNPINTA